MYQLYFDFEGINQRFASLNTWTISIQQTNDLAQIGLGFMDIFQLKPVVHSSSCKHLERKRCRLQMTLLLLLYQLRGPLSQNFIFIPQTLNEQHWYDRLLVFFFGAILPAVPEGIQDSQKLFWNANCSLFAT